jgi:nicotinate-nucleotide adenylyltransferase
VTGLFGGAFDPPHNGHLALVETALARFRLERLVIVVTGRPPHKRVETDPETRFRLAQAAFAAREGVQLSRHELEREGPSYTVDTARWAEREWGDVVLLIGADEFADFLGWKDPSDVLRHARLGVATRPGYPSEAFEEVLEGLEGRERVELFEIPALPLSSSEIRARVRRGDPIADMVPKAVAREIELTGLYR